MHSGYKLRVVTFGTKRKWSLANVCKHRSMERKAVLSISGNVYKQQEMEIDKLTNDA
jgi:hypothetical protein